MAQEALCREGDRTDFQVWNGSEYESHSGRVEAVYPLPGPHTLFAYTIRSNNVSHYVLEDNVATPDRDDA